MKDSFFTLDIDFDSRKLILLDQTRLPNEELYIRLGDITAIWEAIRSLRVRGAPAIGVAAAYGVCLAAMSSGADNYEDLRKDFIKAKDYLASSRPTAVNLFWALQRMFNRLEDSRGLPVDGILAALREEATLIHKEDIDACRAIGDHGLTLLKPGYGIMTHCNAGALAATRYGTALSPIYRGHEQDYGFRVFADETRPLLQGARLTAWELNKAGVDVTVVCEGMCSSVMQNGWIDACIVGCDRLAANGDAANKIGTSTLARVAKSFGIPFYVAAPVSTIDMACEDGGRIEIEQRDPAEVTDMWYERPMAPSGVKVYNPAFDVTPAEYISAIITERGVVYPPFDVGIAAIL